MDLIEILTQEEKTAFLETIYKLTDYCVTVEKTDNFDIKFDVNGKYVFTVSIAVKEIKELREE